jgi:Sulfatase-modifying factor enzyme 1
LGSFPGAAFRSARCQILPIVSIAQSRSQPAIIFRYRVFEVGRGTNGLKSQLRGRVEIGDRAVGVDCDDQGEVHPVPEFCIAYLHDLKVADLQVPPIAQCDGVEVSVGITKQKRCLPRLPSPVQGFRDCPACPEMVVVPSGSFVMGSPVDEPGWGRGEDQVDVTMAKPFAVGRFAVTYAEWEACLDVGGCAGHRALRALDAGWEWEQRGKRPVIGVRWHAAKAYVEWLSKTTGKTYRLLSEAEREYVTRAGTCDALLVGHLHIHRPGQLRRKRRPRGWHGAHIAESDGPGRHVCSEPVGPLSRARQHLGMDRRLRQRQQHRQPGRWHGAHDRRLHTSHRPRRRFDNGRSVGPPLGVPWLVARG